MAEYEEHAEYGRIWRIVKIVYSHTPSTTSPTIETSRISVNVSDYICHSSAVDFYVNIPSYSLSISFWY